MSVQQYGRKVSLLVGGDSGDALDLSELRIAFAVRRGDLQTPNSADIRVYNLSDGTAARVLQRLPTPEFTRVVLQAGYEGNFGVIFDGTIKQVRHGRESQTDTYIDITAADGDSAYNFAVTSVSLAAGQTAPKDQINALMNDMAPHGVTPGYIPDLGGNPLPRGKVFYGMCRDGLRQIARNTSSSWSIQDGKVEFIPLTAYKPGEVPLINSETGMIGLPEQTQNGINVRTLLNPNLKIGQKIQLNNDSIQQQRYGLSVTDQSQVLLVQQSNKLNSDGFYYVMVADHIGDSRGITWYSDLTCLAIDATTTVELSRKASVGPVGPVREFG